MFDKFTIFVPKVEFEQSITSAIALANKSWLKTYPNEYFPKIIYQPQYYKGPSFKIEFSAPKLLYGNNLLEVVETDFPVIMTQLCLKLSKMGFKIDYERIAYNKNIVNMEIGKNIFTGNLPEVVVLEHLAVAKPPRSKMKLQKTSFIVGEQIFFKGISHEMTFYDKYPELVTKYGWSQFNLDEFFRWNKHKNILRMEIRLHKAQIEALVGKNPTLEELFKEKWVDKAFTKYWDPLFEHLKHTAPYVTPETELLLYKDQNMDPAKIKDLFMVKHFINKYGYAEAKRQLGQLLGEKEAQKMMKLLDNQPEMAIMLPVYNFMPILNEAIKSHNWLTPERLATMEDPQIAYDTHLHKLEWDTKESSKYLGVGVREIQKRCQKGLLPYRLEAGSYRLKAEDVIFAKYKEQTS